MDIQELDRRAVELSRSIVATVTSDQLSLPTPCADWDLGALLAHMSSQHHGFARAVDGERTELADWRPTPLGDDPVGAYHKAADRVISSFAAAGALERPAYLPEIRGGITVPGRVAISFHFIDYVVHGWDVAATVGHPFDADADLLAAALVVAAQVPDDDASRQPGMAFGPKLPDVPGGGQLDRLLTVLGRSPTWPN
ncbi:MAG TPA: TIGR03086 family metal-binding protein [Pseudonocardiaceae bacterium]